MKRRLSLPFLLLAALALAGCGKPPSSAAIEVPFTSQAPTGDWSQPWQDACEETSIYMVSSFYAGDAIKRDEAVRRIREILQVKDEKIRVSKDESLATIAQLIDDLGLPWTVRLVADPPEGDADRVHRLAERQPEPQRVGEHQDADGPQQAGGAHERGE